MATASEEINGKVPSEQNPSVPTSQPSQTTNNVDLTAEEKKAIAEERNFNSTTGQSNTSSTQVRTQSSPNADDASTSPSVSPLAGAKIRSNPLTKFSSYNYVIRLQATDKNGSTNLFETKRYDPTNQKWYTLIDSAGGSGGVASTITDKVWFSREYYIDDLTFKSIVGSDNISKATIVCEVEFQITEPYGINFLKELWDFNTKKLKVNNYLDTCYMLTIEWKGFHDDGKFESLNSSNQIKYIPVKIVNISIQLTATGAVYSVSAVPYNYISSTQLFGYVPESISVQGKTLKEIITGDFQPKLNENLKKSAETNYKSINPSPVVEYRFNFVERKINGTVVNIGSYKLSEQNDVNTQNAALGKFENKNIEDELAKNMKSFSLLNRTIPTGQTVTFSGKEQIIEALSQLVIMSEYVTSQIRKFKENYNNIFSQGKKEGKTDLEISKIIQNDKELNKPINWFKILPRVVKENDWNEQTNMYNKVIQFDIVPYVIYDSRNSNNIIGGTKPSNDQVVKEYFYFFTGQNTEVLNCDIKFNTIYFNYLQSNINKINQATGTKPVNNPKEPGVAPQDPAAGETGPDTSAAVSGTPMSPTRQVVNVGKNTIERSKAAQFSSSLYSSTDLIQVTLEIMGDPDLILQDSIMYDTSAMEDEEAEDGYTGSITMTNEEKYMRLTFVSPQDIDLETGLIKKENQSIFDGIYRMNIVTSVLKQGKFTQSLELLKVVMVDPSIKASDRNELPDPPNIPLDFGVSFSNIPNAAQFFNSSNLPGPPEA